MTVTVSIVEDKPGTREGLVKLFNGTPGIQCLRAYANGEDALRGIPEERPQVAVVDILAQIARRENTYEAFNYRTREFRSAGAGIVLMEGRLQIESRNTNGKQSSELSFLAVWREEAGRWRLLAWQAGRIPGAVGQK
jgi:DNA-binding NarL/FixJ family response regulator